ncbi:MAG: hypothetical protein SFY96_12840 [Planctomycetota bacterium]|nr:hypothetical protein [Planctomycetota bacterium]
MKRLNGLVACAASILCAASGLAAPTPLSAEFTYQGSLNTTGGAYTGLADMRFRLYDEAAAGGQIGAQILIKKVFVDRGLFTVPIDFGVGSFNGDNRWMEIDVSTPAGSGVFTTLAGRQKVTATPYALQTRGLFTDSLLNVGVGTTSPQARLNVNGVLRVDDGELELVQSGALRLYTANGSSAIATNSDGAALFTSAMGSSLDQSGFVELRTPSGALTAILEGDNDNTIGNGVQVGALRLGSEGTGAGGGLISVLNNDGRETFNLVGGASASSSILSLFATTGTASTLRLNGEVAGLGGGVYTRDQAGVSQFLAEPDFDGSGVYVTLGRNNVNFDYGVVFDTNFNGTNSVLGGFRGNGSSSWFDTSVGGNNSVILPNDAISAPEMLDEPGVANNHVDLVGVTTSPSPMTSRSITVPGPGYVVAFAQGDLEITHTAGLITGVAFGVSQSPSTLPSNQDVQTNLPGAAPAGLYDFAAPAHGLFTIASAGTYTFYFNAYRFTGSGSARMFDVQLTLMYFPTNYGTVVSNLTSPGATPQVCNVVPEHVYGPLTGDEIVAEQDAEFARHNASVNNELAQMRQQMAQMHARMNQIAAQQASMRAKSMPAAPAATPKQGNVDMSMLPVVATPK